MCQVLNTPELPEVEFQKEENRRCVDIPNYRLLFERELKLLNHIKLQNSQCKEINK